MEAYPLSWPPSWPRKRNPQPARFGNISIVRAIEKILHQLRLMKAGQVVISSNLRMRKSDGLPSSNQRQPIDKGVAVYFNWKNKSQCIPCDRWDKVEDNMVAIVKTIDALRGIKRWGADEMVDAAFMGFKKIGMGTGDNRPWYEILGISQNATLDEARIAYKDLAFKHHPDQGGLDGKMVSINAAFESAKIAAG